MSELKHDIIDSAEQPALSLKCPINMCVFLEHRRTLSVWRIKLYETQQRGETMYDDE